MAQNDRKKRAEEEKAKAERGRAITEDYFASEKFRERVRKTYESEGAPGRDVNKTVESVRREAAATEIDFDEGEYPKVQPGDVEAYAYPRNVEGNAGNPFIGLFLDDAIKNEQGGLRTGSVTGHEMSHTAYAGSGLEFGNLPFQSRLISNLSNKKEKDKADPEEVRGDINATRVEFAKTGLYDAGKEDFTIEHLRRYREHLKQTGQPMEMSMQRLIDEFGEDGYVRLMNMIAAAPQAPQLPPNAQDVVDRLRQTQFRPPGIFA